MDTMTLYVDKKSPIHSIDPLTKLIYAMVNIAIAYILNRLVPISFNCTDIFIYFREVFEEFCRF